MANKSVTCKIHLVHSDSLITINFGVRETIADATKKVARLHASELPNPHEYGLLFRSTSDPSEDRWLDGNRNFAFHRIKNNDFMEFRKRIRPLKVKMADDTQKLVMVDESLPVGEIVQSVCERVGLSNFEEYSLQYDPATNKSDKPKKKGAEDEKDEESWLDHEMTLRELSIFEDHFVLLRKKFFFSDQNVNRDDPVQINMLYAQSRESIVDGTHPCTLDEAVQFAALQMHIDFGEYNESRHKPGFLDNLRNLLPAEYVKTKGVEKMIYAEHKKLMGRKELNIKYRYYQLCRSLKTYGMTFFSVKEKVKGKNKLVPRLLGITRECVMRLDEKTKEVLKTWPLTTVRRWAASPTSFTLDFGDYADSYYSVQTTEGEKISQLIAGYIDIILKRDKNVKKGDSAAHDSKASEVVLSGPEANKATRASMKVPKKEGAVAHSARIHTAGISGSASPRTQRLRGEDKAHSLNSPKGQRASVKRPGNAQVALSRNISMAVGEIQRVSGDLAQFANLPQLGDDPASVQWRQNKLDVARQNVSAEVAAIAASTASVLTLTFAVQGVKSEINFTAVGSAVTTLSSNLVELSKNAPVVAALSSTSATGNQVLQASRELGQASLSLLQALAPTAQGGSNRAEMLKCAGLIGVSASQLLAQIGDDAVPQDVQDLLHLLAKNVATATTQLISKAKDVAGKVSDANLQNNVIVAAKSAALATSQLVLIAKTVAPCITSPLCQEQLVESARQVAGAVEGVVSSSQAACSDQTALQPLAEAATAVTTALATLIGKVRDGNSLKGTSEETEVDEACATILSATDRLYAVMGSASEMVKQTKVIASAATVLVSHIKAKSAKENDKAKQTQLINNAKALAEATGVLVQAAKVAAKAPNDSNAQNGLRSAAAKLSETANVAASNALKKKVLAAVENTAKQTASVLTQLIAASQGSESSNSNETSKKHLNETGRFVVEKLTAAVAAIKNHYMNPDNANAQLELLSNSQALLPPASKLVSAAKAAVPTVSEAAAAMQLSSFIKSTTTAIGALNAALTKALDLCGSLNYEGAVDSIKQVQKSLQGEIQAAQGRKLLPLPGETIEHSVSQLGASAKNVNAAVAQIVSGYSQSDSKYTAGACKDSAHALQALAKSVRGVASTALDGQKQVQMLTSCDQLMGSAVKLFSEAAAVGSSTSTESLQRHARAMAQAIQQVVSCLPGQGDLDSALNAISAQASTLSVPGYSQGSSGQVAESQQALNTAAVAYGRAVTHIASTASSGNAVELSQAAKGIKDAFGQLVQEGMKLAAMTPSDAARGEIVSFVKAIATSSAKLISSGKMTAFNPTENSAKTQLTSAVRAIATTINQLIASCTTSGKTKKECESGIRTMEAAGSRLLDPSVAINDDSFFQCLEFVLAQSKVLGTSMAGIATNIRAVNQEKFCDSVRDACQAVVKLTDAGAQAAYLVGISDMSSEAAEPGLLDSDQLSRAQTEINSACDRLLQVHAGKDDILSAATTIAKHTSLLCGSCKAASVATNNNVAKRQFLSFAKQVASSVSGLVSDIKLLAKDSTSENRERCNQSLQPLLKAIGELTVFASNEEFSARPAIISAKARENQKPICDAGNGIISAACNLIGASELLISNPKDPASWQTLATNSKAVSDSIKELVASIRARAPGQTECDNAIMEMGQLLSSVEDAQLRATVGKLDKMQSNTLEGFQEDLGENIETLRELIDPVVRAAKAEPHRLGHSVIAVTNLFGPLSVSAIGIASHASDQESSISLLEQTVTLIESGMQVIQASRDAGGNSQATKLHKPVDEAATNLKEAIHDLGSTMSSLEAAAGNVTGHLSQLSAALNRIELNETVDVSGKSFLGCLESMNVSCKVILSSTQEMMTKAVSNPESLGGYIQTLNAAFSDLASESHSAGLISDSSAVTAQIKSATRVLGESCGDMITSVGLVQSSPDKMSRRELAQSCRTVIENVSHLMSALQSGSRGTQMCISAAEDVDAMIVDLDTAIMFASAGSLQAEPDSAFVNYREGILQDSKALVENTKQLVSAAGAAQDVLAAAAEGALRTFESLNNGLKSGSACLGAADSQAQVLLLNSAKDVACALSELLTSTKNASGKSMKDASMEDLKTDAKGMVSAISSLLKTVKSVEDNAARNIRAIEVASDAIRAEISLLSSSDIPNASGKPEDFVNCTRLVTDAIRGLVAAISSGKPDAMIEAANNTRKAVVDFIRSSKVASSTAEPELQSRILKDAKACASGMNSLLEIAAGLRGKSAGSAEKKSVLEASKAVATAMADAVQAAHQLKGSDLVDVSDPSVVAEQELFTAAAAIEAASKKLATLAPRPKIAINENLSFDETILEAAKSIASATTALVKAATQAQRQLIKAGAATPTDSYHKDATWSSGLVSAAKTVALATTNLCEAANATVEGAGTMEKLIASAKSVSKSTAQLLVACKVRTDVQSSTIKGLQAAGNAVKKAADSLVKAALKAQEEEEIEISEEVETKLVAGMRQEIEAAEKILRQEQELEAAKKNLARIRATRYKRTSVFGGSS